MFHIQLGSRFTADAVANSIFGVDGKALSSEHSEILATGSTIFKTSTIQNVYFVVASLFPIIQRFWSMSLIAKPVEKFFDKLTRDAVRMRTDHHNTREDFLNFLIQLQKKKQLKNIDITAHAITFFLDGYETSSMVIANTIHHLSVNPQIQEKLRNEIEAVVSSGDEISFEQIQDLEYLEQVINGRYNRFYIEFQIV